MSTSECAVASCGRPVARKALDLSDGILQFEELCEEHFEAVNRGLQPRTLSVSAYKLYWRNCVAGSAVSAGVRLLTGDGVDQDARLAITYFEYAISLGSVDGHIWLARMYSDGVGGVPKDDRRAVLHYRDAFRRSLRPPRHWGRIWLLGSAYLQYALGSALVRISGTAA